MDFATQKSTLESLPLTNDDKSLLEKRGNLAKQLEKSVGKVVSFESASVQKRGNKDLTFLHLADESGNTANLAIAYDLRNVYFTDNPEHSLRELGQATQGKAVLPKLAKFKLDKIEDTGEFGFKYSRASQELKYSIEDFASENFRGWASVRAKYNSSEDMRKMRTDLDYDISHYEIKKIFITALES